MSSDATDAPNVEHTGSTPPPPPPPPPAPLSVVTNAATAHTSSTPSQSKAPTPAPPSGNTDGANQEADFSPEELTLFVEKLLDQLNTKFDNVSHQLFGKMEEMSTRIEDLEKSISGLMQSVDEDPKLVTSSAKA
ncbi:hypothetical protein DFQ27_004309 [Actinomortierella ambigua]|uniref:Heat shock factor binding protein 1-domain-containing protein n=1 Tax=Actinomortierella ambigua TaxID=1343610 RepID=A0A9P6QI57_9FUNG|nr:hypothetical protein DFQ26_003010 [Actinomortierella ambigua]KAG0269247.1 hypothetical protein DFQ27_004309 [Actinomortierella ambigua]